MTLDEAKLVAGVVETAEGGCGGCVNEAVRDLNEVFLGFTFSLVEVPILDPAYGIFEVGKYDPTITVVVRPPKAKAPAYRSSSCGA